ncbi:MAG: rhodanese-like domain-containing protein, partial [Gammaproteobacteria bacterium]|nr:rhodanese-like domain-containing protein [Gammaproteobacteria bacterium]NIR26521.1 rhodanese-like domain-containing protein [Gammaproteobacteria bacterium]NIY20254.1 rhodanese-like domain-containing protein [Gammaproteobacteria bacterium]
MAPEDLEALIADGRQPVVLDVRSAFEFKSGHIPGAIHAPLPGLKAVAGDAVDDKSSKVVLVCEHGPRAQIARIALKLSGYRDLELLEGHMSLWR